MGQVAISLNGRSFRFVCGDGEEQRISALAAYVRSKLDQLGHEHGRAGDDRLLVMAALMIADELFDAREIADVEFHPAPVPGASGPQRQSAPNYAVPPQPPTQARSRKPNAA